MKTWSASLDELLYYDLLIQFNWTVNKISEIALKCKESKELKRKWWEVANKQDSTSKFRKITWMKLVEGTNTIWGTEKTIVFSEETLRIKDRGYNWEWTYKDIVRN